MQAEKIIGIRKVGIKPTIDIEVDHNKHIFYGNNIAVGNSHAYAYGVNGYLSAYIKAHFLTEFYCAWLNFAKDRKPKPKIEVQELVNEAKLNDIDIYTPDIRYMELNFHITSPTQILFGLANVGGIGEVTANKFINIIKEKEKEFGKFEEWSWYKFLCLIAPEVGRTTLINLISVGAFKHFNKSRRSMIQEILQFKDLFKTAKKEIEWIQIHWHHYQSLIDLLEGLAKPKKDGGGASSDKRRTSIDSVREMLANPKSSMEDDLNEIAVTEEFLLGISITCSRSDGKPGERSNITCKEFLDGMTRPYMVFKVQIDEVKEWVINKGNEENIGRTMAFLKISDSSCKLDNVTIFADLYEGNEEEEIVGCKELLTVGRVLEIRAEPSKKGGLVIKEVWEI